MTSQGPRSRGLLSVLISVRSSAIFGIADPPRSFLVLHLFFYLFLCFLHGFLFLCFSRPIYLRAVFSSVNQTVWSYHLPVLKIVLLVFYRL